jgi:hypothetical protein
MSNDERADFNPTAFACRDAALYSYTVSLFHWTRHCPGVTWQVTASCANTTNWTSGGKDAGCLSPQLCKKSRGDTFAVVVLLRLSMFLKLATPQLYLPTVFFGYLFEHMLFSGTRAACIAGPSTSETICHRENIQLQLCSKQCFVLQAVLFYSRRSSLKYFKLLIYLA